MLGKVFENLLGVTERKSKGAFYTPREIVYYMCRESLINYLASNGLDEESVRSLIQNKDNDLSILLDTKEEYEKLRNDDHHKQISAKVYKLLKEIKIVDPAVGSGAFPWAC